MNLNEIPNANDSYISRVNDRLDILLTFIYQCTIGSKDILLYTRFIHIYVYCIINYTIFTKRSSLLKDFEGTSLHISVKNKTYSFVTQYCA